MFSSHKVALKMQEQFQLVSSGFSVIPAEEQEGRVVGWDCAGAIKEIYRQC